MSIRGFTSKVKVHDELIPVNPDTIFRGISLLKKSDGELQKYFEFELAPFPLSLFDEGGLRKTRKVCLLIETLSKEIPTLMRNKNGDMGLIEPFRMGHVGPGCYIGFIRMCVIEISLKMWDGVVPDLL
ncbi:hypothetical protein AVEN_100567-1, partial [Araneus ventricosus]